MSETIFSKDKIAQKMSLCIKISFLKYPTVVAIAGIVLAIIPTVCIFCDVLTAIAKRRFSGKSSSESDIYKVSHFNIYPQHTDHQKQFSFIFVHSTVNPTT